MKKHISTSRLVKQAIFEPYVMYNHSLLLEKQSQNMVALMRPLSIAKQPKRWQSLPVHTLSNHK